MVEQYGIALAGGALIGTAAVWLMASLGRIAGVSNIVGALLPPTRADGAGWRVAFLVGLVLGPLLILAVTGRSPIGAPVATLPVSILGGLLIGVGTALGNGCTSGHGVCGMARLSARSLAATAIFMVCAALTVLLTRHVF